MRPHHLSDPWVNEKHPQRKGKQGRTAGRPEACTVQYRTAPPRNVDVADMLESLSGYPVFEHRTSV